VKSEQTPPRAPVGSVSQSLSEIAEFVHSSTAKPDQPPTNPDASVFKCLRQQVSERIEHFYQVKSILEAAGSINIFE